MTKNFRNIEKCLSDFENVIHGKNAARGFLNDDERYIVDCFEFNLAQALIKDEYIDDEKVAKFIFTIKNLSNEIKIKIE